MQADSDSLGSPAALGCHFLDSFSFSFSNDCMHTILKGALPAKREAPPMIQPTQLQVPGLPVADSLPFLWNRSVQPPSEHGKEVVMSGFLQGGHGILKVMEVA